jgi:hypothetical protein
MRSKRTTAAVLSAAAVAISAGCGNPISHVGSAGVTAKSPQTLALVFVDISKSTYGKNGLERKRYATYFSQVASGLPEGTLVRGDQIDRNPLSDTSLPIHGFIQKYGGLLGSTNKDDVDAQNAAMRTKLRRQFNRLLSERPFGNSILDSLNIAQDVFASYPNVKKKYLLIFSDMIETSSRYRFTDANLAASRVKAFITKQRKSGQLPTLQGVQIYVIGAGATQGSDATPQHVQAVKQFWLTYLTASGARLPAYRYGPTLIRFP